jgi:transposase
MDMHKNAPLTPRGREELVRRVLVEQHRPRAVATALGVCVRTVRKWVARYRAEGQAGLVDRSSRPHRSPNKTSTKIEARVVPLNQEML